jgi:hypothetical protein
LLLSLYKLSNSLLLFENSRVLTNLGVTSRTYLDNNLDYNSRILTLDLFKLVPKAVNTSDFYTIKDLDFLPSSSTLPNFTTNSTYNLLPTDLNNTNENQHYLLLNLLSTQKSHDVLKQSRWSLKNSLVSEELIKQNNMFLNSKRLLGTVSQSQALTDNNI